LTLAPHIGIVEAKLFLVCQHRLDGNKQIDNRRRSEITWLTGLLKCSNCGYSVVPKSSNGGRYTYLHCSGKINGNGCTALKHLGKLSDVENIVRDSVFAWSERYGNLKTTLETRKNNDSERILCRIEELDNNAQKMLDLAIESSDVSAKYINERLEKIAAEHQSLNAELNALNTDSGGFNVKYVADLRSEWDSLDVHAKNGIASLLIKRITLSHNAAEITWAYNFE